MSPLQDPAFVHALIHEMRNHFFALSSQAEALAEVLGLPPSDPTQRGRAELHAASEAFLADLCELVDGPPRPRPGTVAHLFATVSAALGQGGGEVEGRGREIADAVGVARAIVTLGRAAGGRGRPRWSAVAEDRRWVVELVGDRPMGDVARFLAPFAIATPGEGRLAVARADAALRAAGCTVEARTGPPFLVRVTVPAVASGGQSG